MNNKKVSIYYLGNENDNEIFYIGQTSQPLQKRLYNHIYTKNKELRKYLIKHDKNKNISIFLIEECQSDDRFLRELFWINHFLSQGHPLLNISGTNRVFNREKKMRTIDIPFIVATGRQFVKRCY